MRNYVFKTKEDTVKTITELMFDFDKIKMQSFFRKTLDNML